MLVSAGCAIATAEEGDTASDSPPPIEHVVEVPEQALRPIALLIANHGHAEDSLAQFEHVRDALNQAVSNQADAVILAEEHDAARARWQERAHLLAEVASIPDALPAVRDRVARLLAATTMAAVASAEVGAADAARERFEQEAMLLQEVVDDVAWQSATLREDQEIEQALVDRENAAQRAADEARRREEATDDATMRQLFAQERALREELVTLAKATRVDSELTRKAREFEADFQARQVELMSRVDALPREPLADERVDLVDPIVEDLLQQRRFVWGILNEARNLSKRTEQELAELHTSKDRANDAHAAEQGRERELGGSALWRQRVSVAEAQLEVINAKIAVVTERQERVRTHSQLLSNGIEFYSVQLRDIVDRASPAGRRLVYGLFDVDTWSDASQRLKDRILRAEALLEASSSAQFNLRSQPVETLLWLGGLAGRVLVVVVLLMIGLRSVPMISRRFLDVMLGQPMFRRRPSIAVKLFELVRITARPTVTYIGVTYLVSPIVNAVAELAFIQWAIDAFFAYKVGSRIAQTIALPRWYRERAGMVSTGTEDDLRPDEAAVADMLRLDLERGTKFVRSAHIALLVATLWYYASDIVVGIVGVSVLSGLITNATKVAIVIVVVWMLSAWKDEFASVFKRLAGNRMPEATNFVERNKDRPWGVIVIGVVSIVVMVWEFGIFVRRGIRETELAKRASAYAFKTKIELQQRDEMSGDATAVAIPADLEAAFDPRTIQYDADCFVERVSLSELSAKTTPLIDRGHGVIVVLGEPGSGRTTTCQWLLRDREVTLIEFATRTHTVEALMRVLAGAFEVEASDFDELVATVCEVEPRMVYLDSFEQLYLRDIGGYDAYKQFMEFVHRCGRRHLFVIAANKFAWDFMTRVSDNRHVVHVLAELQRWTDDELRALIELRMARLPHRVSFNELADGVQDSEVVKTSRGYYRFLAQFSRGLPASAMHYWTHSLSGAGTTFSVRLFPRPSAAKLVAAPPPYRFFLASVVRHGTLSGEQAATVDNTPRGTCELAVDYFIEAGVIVEDDEGNCRLTCAMAPIVFRHLEDSNLL